MAKRTKQRITEYQVMGILAGCFIAGFVTGRFTLPDKVEAAEEVQAVEVTPTPTITPTATPTPTVVPTEAPVPLYDVPLPEEEQLYLIKLCEANSVPPELVIAIIEKESTYNPDAVSRGGDYGYMQINKCNHKWLREAYGVENFLDPYENILCGVMIISEYLDKYGDYNKALMAYNMGEGGAKRMWKKGVYSTKYSRTVISIMEGISYEQ